jgi:acyl-CoA thioesterase-1
MRSRLDTGTSRSSGCKTLLMTTSVDRRVCFVGDSFVAGVGDPEHRGWVSRLAAWSHRAGRPLTAYNLGVRRDTSEDVRQRLPTEVASRQAAGCDHRLVVSFGVNDTTVVEGVVRVEPAVSVANLLRIAEHAAAESVPLLVIGPPPVADLGQNKRVTALRRRFRRRRRRARVPLPKCSTLSRPTRCGCVRCDSETERTRRPAATSGSPSSCSRPGRPGSSSRDHVSDWSFMPSCEATKPRRS